MAEQLYTEYFSEQAGGGRRAAGIGPVYAASYSRQKGSGCCGLTGRYISAAATPLLAKGVRALGEEAAAAGINFYRDIAYSPAPITMTRLRDAAVSRLAEAGRNLKRRAKRTLSGRGRKVKRKASKPKKSKRKTRAKATRAKKKSTKGARKTKTAQTGRGRSRDHSPIFDIFS